MQFNIDFFPIFRPNWSPRAKWRSALIGIRAAHRLSYFAAAAASLSNTQMERSGFEFTRHSIAVEGGGGEEEEKDGLGQGNIFSEHVHQEP